MKDIFVSTAILVLLLMILGIQLLTPGSGGNVPSEPPERIRQFAAALENQELYAQAVQEYERYLAAAQIPDEQRANLLYKIGTIYLDNLENYESALTAFLKISQFYPKSPVTRDAEKRMVKCYESMKRGFDAQKKLKKLTDLDEEKEPPGTGPVAAKIGDRTITLDQIEREIAQLPDYERKNFDSPEKKMEYLRSKVFQELLYDDAIRKEYQKNPEIRKRTREYEKFLLANKVLEEEVRQKVTVSPSDLEMYYKAHPEEFTQPAMAQVSHIRVDSKEKAEEVKKALESGKSFEEAITQYSQDEATKTQGGKLGTIYKGMKEIPGIGNAPEIVDTLLAMKEGAISEPIPSPKGIHIFKITQLRPEKQYSLEEVKSNVEQRVRQMREKEKQQELLDQMLKSEKVAIYDQVFQSATAASTPLPRAQKP